MKYIPVIFNRLYSVINNKYVFIMEYCLYIYINVSYNFMTEKVPI